MLSFGALLASASGLLALASGTLKDITDSRARRRR
jgi:hypothetical protein